MKHSYTSELPNPVNDFLAKHGIDGWKIFFDKQNRYHNVIVVPAIDEYENIRSLFQSLISNDDKYFKETLILFVVNNLRSSSGEVKQNNRQTITFLKNIIERRSENTIEEKIIESGLNIGYVDASSDGHELPEKDGGVGLARKIGMDLVLTVFNYQSKGKKIIICLDADCTVDKNYLTTIIETFNGENVKAGYVKYEHTLPDNEKQKLAIVCYEIFLRYYVLGLKYAGSPYAFPTIGSTMVCDYESYIQAGGMNKRKAAEDFYFLEKLAKITSIHGIKGTKVFPSSRGSWRVPFGTGQRVNRFLSGTNKEYFLYDPAVFEILKDWNEIFYGREILNANSYLAEAEKINKSLKKFLLMNSFDEQWEKILNSSKTETQVQKQKLAWFDGFRTLKLIHFLRDNDYPPVNMFDALDKMFEVSGYKFRVNRTEAIPNLDVQMKYLEVLRS